MTTETKPHQKFNGVLLFIAVLLLVISVQLGILIKNQENSSSKTVVSSKQTAANTPGSRPVTMYRGAYQSPPQQGRSQSAQPSQPSAWQDPFFADPFDMMQRMQERMHSLFDAFLTYDTPFASSFGSGLDFSPAIDLKEEKDSYVVTADIPGLDKDKIDISVQGSLLTLQGTRESESKTEDAEKGYFSQERSYGSFARILTLPGPVDESAINADYKNGVLTVILPKGKSTEPPQKVKIT